MTLTRALSGELEGTCDNKSYKLTCKWSAKQSIANNTSTITAEVYLQAPSGWSTISSNWSCVINGTTVTSGKSATVSGTKVLLGSRTWPVTHGSDGKLSTTISFSYNNGLSSAGTYTTKKGSGSKSITLDTIPRTSSFTLSSSSLNMGSSQTVKITKASSSFTHTIQYTFGGTTTNVVTKTGNESYSFTPPVSLASKITTATSGTCTVKVTTYSGDTNIGSASKTFTLKVPSSVKPSVTLATTYNNTLGGVSIAGKSTVKVVPTGTEAYGSAIKSYSYSGAGLSGTGSSKTTGTLSAGSYTITVTATDSRGRTGSANVSFTIYAYSAPSLSISVYRCDKSGNKTANGTYAKAKLTYAISNPNNKNANAKQYKIEKKTSTASSYTVHEDWTNLTGGYTSTDSSVLDLGSGFADTTSYDIKISIRDSYSTASATQRISTISAILNIEKNGVGIGKLYEQGKLDINGNVYLSGGALKFGGSPSAYARIGYTSASESSDGLGCTFIANGSNNWFRLKDNKTITYGGTTVAMDGGTINRMTASNWWYSTGNTGWYNATYDGGWYMNDSSWVRSYNNKGIYTGGEIKSGGSLTVENKYVTIGKYEDTFNCVQFKRYNSGAGGNILGKVGVTSQDSGPALALEVGTHASGFELTRRYVFSNASFTVRSNNAVSNGSSAMKWTAVYATNGTVQTSDERFKVKRGYTDTQECYELVKNTPIYNYITLGENKEDLSKNRLGKTALKNSENDINLHMGIMAQDIQKYNCSKQILSEGEYEKADGTIDTMLHVNPYNLTSAIMGALQEDIKKQEILEQRVNTVELENQNLKQELAELKATVSTILNNK